MYDSKYTDYTIVKMTPYKRDVLRELADACKKQDLKLGLYFSLIDWHYPAAMPISSHNSDSIPPEHFEYNKKQVKELLTNYGEISELWFDMGSHTLQQSIEMKEWVRKFQPNCMVGGRIGNGMGDFMVMSDNQEPDYIIGAPWQSPASFFDETWSYRSWQERGNEKDKYLEKLTSLINVCSRGGNFLLNIGPRGDGSVVKFESDILEYIGKWLTKNGDAIYGAKSDPFHKAFEWGAITAKPNKLYLSILSLPENNKIILSGLKGKVESVKILGENIDCENKTSTNGDFLITIPKKVDPTIDISVIEISFSDGYSVSPVDIIPFNGSKLLLDQYNSFKYFSNSGVDYNSRYQSTIKELWTLYPSLNKTIKPSIYYSEQELGKKAFIQLGAENVLVHFDENADKINLKVDPKAIIWGDIYFSSAEQWSTIENMPADIENIDLSKPFGNLSWDKSNILNNETFEFEGGLMRSYYVLQEITSVKDQKMIVAITSGDGVVIALNGRIQVVHGNLQKNEIEDIVVLDLKKGVNQLFVKVFTNFQKETKFMINNLQNQHLYKKDLPSQKLSKNTYFTVSWMAIDPLVIHETLNYSNVKLEIK